MDFAPLRVLESIPLRYFGMTVLTENTTAVFSTKYRPTFPPCFGQWRTNGGLQPLKAQKEVASCQWDKVPSLNLFHLFIPLAKYSC